MRFIHNLSFNIGQKNYTDYTMSNSAQTMQYLLWNQELWHLFIQQFFSVKKKQEKLCERTRFIDVYQRNDWFLESRNLLLISGHFVRLPRFFGGSDIKCCNLSSFLYRYHVWQKDIQDWKGLNSDLSAAHWMIKLLPILMTAWSPSSM